MASAGSTATNSVRLAEDAGAQIGVLAGKLNQASFVRAVQEGNVKVIDALLKNGKVDVNAYNSEGLVERNVEDIN